MSRTGLILSGLYILLAAYLISTQGLFGESFIALILGLPWSMVPVFFEFGGSSGPVIIILLLVPMVINAVALYWIGVLLEYLFRTKAA